MCARPRKPASLKKGKSETKTELKKRAEAEEQLMGSTDKLHKTPEHLSEMSRIYYRFLVEELEVSDILSNLDIPLLEQTADCLCRLRECDERINREGMIISYVNGVGEEILKTHPIVDVKHKYLSQFRALCTQLGLSPASRASLAGMKVEQKEKNADPLLQILKGGEMK